MQLSTYNVACGAANSSSALPYRGVLDLSTQSDFRTAKALIPIAVYTDDNMFGVAAITSKRYLNVAGDNKTYTCIVAYLY